MRLTHTNTLRELYIGRNGMTATGATAIANSLLLNTSLEALHMPLGYNAIGRDGAMAMTRAIISNKTLKELLLFGDDTITNEESVMIIIKGLHDNSSSLN